MSLVIGRWQGGGGVNGRKRACQVVVPALWVCRLCTTPSDTLQLVVKVFIRLAVGKVGRCTCSSSLHLALSFCLSICLSLHLPLCVPSKVHRSIFIELFSPTVSFTLFFFLFFLSLLFRLVDFEVQNFRY